MPLILGVILFGMAPRIFIADELTVDRQQYLMYHLSAN